MTWGAAEAGAREMRRSMPHLRPLLMGDAHVAVADESSSLFYNPAGLTGLEEGVVEPFGPQITFNEPFRIALVDPDQFNDEIEQVGDDLENEDYETLLGREFFTDVTLRAPVVVIPDPGLAVFFGIEALANLQILQNRVVPLVHVEFFGDAVAGLSKFGYVTEDLWLGGTVKVINRRGVDRIYTAGDFAATADSAGSLENRPEFQDLRDGVSFTRLGLDLGAIYRLPFWRGWHPRIGFSALNIGGADEDGLTGMEFGPRDNDYESPQAGELPQINTVGFAVSPDFGGVRLTVALDVVDVSRTALPGDDYAKRVRAGAELGLFPHRDGTARLGILVGYNTGHTSFGVLSRVWIFEVGFGQYTVELGDQTGDNPDKRTIFTLALRF